MLSLEYLKVFFEAFEKTWALETSRHPNKWSQEKNYIGQDDVSTLVIQKYFNGQIIKYPINDSDCHYFNLLNDETCVNAVPSKKSIKIERSEEFIIPKQWLYSADGVVQRFFLLDKLVIDYLKNNYIEVYNQLDQRVQA